jgi:mRNA-degrading endonuclease RelE of RelBE toxin-antitoxin system
MGLREKQDSRVILEAPRDVTLLSRARRDLLALPAVERSLLARHVDALAMDAAPRGAAVLEGEHRDHLCLRVGRFRLLYRVREDELAVVAVTTRHE